MTRLALRVGDWVRPPGRRHLAVFAALTGAGQTEAVLSLLGAVVLIRVAGAETAGEVFFAQAVAALWFTFLDPKLDDTTQRFVPLHQATGRGRGSGLFDRLLRFDAVTGLLATLAAGLGVLFAGGAGWVAPGQTALLLLALAAGGAAAPLGTIGAGFAVAGELRRLGVLRSAAAGAGFAATLAALLAGGPAAYLAVGALCALATSWALGRTARRTVIRAFGPPPERPVPMPEGILRFTVKSSAAASAAALSDRGPLVLAGALGGPSLVTFLKIAGAPGRLYLSFINAASSQIYPRIASAAVLGDGAAIRRDALRSSALLTVSGVATMIASAVLAAPAVILVYGREYAWLAGGTVVLLGAACVRGAVVWAKVLAPGLGRPGIRLGYVIAEGTLTLAVLALAVSWAAAPEDVPAAFAWGSVALAVARVATWLAVLRALTDRDAMNG